MSEMGFESAAPSEDGGNASEGLSEQAKAKFAAGQAAMVQNQKEEKKAKKKDDSVAQVIIQFLTDEQKTHLATLISRLVAVDCPSHFILAILSLINDDCRKAVEEYLKEQGMDEANMQTLPTVQGNELAADNKAFATWIVRMQAVLAADSQRIVKSLLVEDGNIDGTVLQVTVFVLQDYLEGTGKKPNFEELQQLSINILQSVFGRFMEHGHLEEPKEEA